MAKTNKISSFIRFDSSKNDLTKVFTTKSNAIANVLNQDLFFFSTQFDIIEPKLYIKRINGFYIIYKFKTIKEKLNQPK